MQKQHFWVRVPTYFMTIACKSNMLGYVNQHISHNCMQKQHIGILEPTYFMTVACKSSFLGYMNQRISITATTSFSTDCHAEGLGTQQQREISFRQISGGAPDPAIRGRLLIDHAKQRLHAAEGGQQPTGDPGRTAAKRATAETSGDARGNRAIRAMQAAKAVSSCVAHPAYQLQQQELSVAEEHEHDAAQWPRPPQA